MPVRVRFRFNKRTGEVEEFLVDDQDQTLSEAAHDQAARAVARMIAVSPAIVPVDDHELSALATSAAGDTTAARSGERENHAQRLDANVSTDADRDERFRADERARADERDEELLRDR